MLNRKRERKQHILFLFLHSFYLHFFLLIQFYFQIIMTMVSQYLLRYDIFRFFVLSLIIFNNNNRKIRISACSSIEEGK